MCLDDDDYYYYFRMMFCWVADGGRWIHLHFGLLCGVAIDDADGLFSFDSFFLNFFSTTTTTTTLELKNSKRKAASICFHFPLTFLSHPLVWYRTGIVYR